MSRQQSAGMESAPAAGPSFVDDLRVVHGPRALLGRYFLGTERWLGRRGITVRFADFGAIARLNAEHRASWDMLLPMLDPAQNPVAPENAFAFLVHDARGDVVSSMCARLYDFTGTTLAGEVQSKRFYYGEEHAHLKARIDSTVSAPVAATMTGRVAYLGGYWLRPDVRATGLSPVIPRLMRYLALTRWNAVLEFSYGRAKFLRPEIARTYAFEHVEEDFTFHLDGRLIWRGVIVWTSREEMIGHLPGLIADLERAARADPEDAVRDGVSFDDGSRDQKTSAG